jgi:hypothetical protein
MSRRNSKVIGPGLSRDVDLRRLASELRIPLTTLNSWRASIDEIRIYKLKSGSVSATPPSNVQLFDVPRIPTTEIF